MIEWMALLCLTGDWYRKGMSIVDSHPSMSPLYLRCLCENIIINDIAGESRAESSRWIAQHVRNRQRSPLNPKHARRLIEHTAELQLIPLHDFLIDMSLLNFSEMISHDSRKEKSKSWAQIRLQWSQLEVLFFAPIQIEMSKIRWFISVFVLFASSPMTFRFSFRARSEPRKGLIWRWNTFCLFCRMIPPSHSTNGKALDKLRWRVCKWNEDAVIVQVFRVIGVVQIRGDWHLLEPPRRSACACGAIIAPQTKPNRIIMQILRLFDQ